MSFTERVRKVADYDAFLDAHEGFEDPNDNDLMDNPVIWDGYTYDERTIKKVYLEKAKNQNGEIKHPRTNKIFNYTQEQINNFQNNKDAFFKEFNRNITIIGMIEGAVYKVEQKARDKAKNEDPKEQPPAKPAHSSPLAKVTSLFSGAFSAFQGPSNTNNSSAPQPRGKSSESAYYPPLPLDQFDPQKVSNTFDDEQLARDLQRQFDEELHITQAQQQKAPSASISQNSAVAQLRAMKIDEGIKTELIDYIEKDGKYKGNPNPFARLHFAIQDHITADRLKLLKRHFTVPAGRAHDIKDFSDLCDWLQSQSNGPDKYLLMEDDLTSLVKAIEATYTPPRNAPVHFNAPTYMQAQAPIVSQAAPAASILQSPTPPKCRPTVAELNAITMDDKFRKLLIDYVENYVTGGSRSRKFLLDLADQITDKELKKLKKQCNVPTGDASNMKTSLDLIQWLEQNGFMGSGEEYPMKNLTQLAKALGAIYIPQSTTPQKECRPTVAELRTMPLHPPQLKEALINFVEKNGSYKTSSNPLAELAIQFQSLVHPNELKNIAFYFFLNDEDSYKKARDFTDLFNLLKSKSLINETDISALTDAFVASRKYSSSNPYEILTALSTQQNLPNLRLLGLVYGKHCSPDRIRTLKFYLDIPAALAEKIKDLCGVIMYLLAAGKITASNYSDLIATLREIR